jgi:hypothetical protein
MRVWVSVCVCVCARALDWGAVGSGTPADLWATVARIGAAWPQAVFARVTRVAGGWSPGRRRDLEAGGIPWGGRSGSRRWQWPACLAAAPACGWGALGGLSGPGVSPKSLFRPHMGAGLRKWRGSQISEGQGRGGRSGRTATLGRASPRTLDVAAAAPPPQTFLRANFPVPATWAAAEWIWQGPGNPVLPP